VTEPARERQTFRFGMFELDDDSGELRKDGKILPKPRDQALRILVMLLQRPRSLVTRDELRRRLWSSDTFVDFDHGLNTAINQLRGALGDSASNPRFIETLPRRGYRFIAPVEVAVRSNAPTDTGTLAFDPAEEALASVGISNQADSTPVNSSMLSDACDLPPVSTGIVRILFSLIQLLYLSLYIVSLARLPEVEKVLAESGRPTSWILAVLVLTAAVGIPVRLYLFAAAAFNYRGLNLKFQKLFPFVFPLDELWALAPFLIFDQIGIGLAIGITAALLYLPFSQRSLLLMGFSTQRT
jgi:cholera toxin transcriptional activator